MGFEWACRGAAGMALPAMELALCVRRFHVDGVYSDDISLRRMYAVRLHPRRHRDPLLKVKPLLRSPPPRSKWKVRFLSGELEGLVTWVRPAQFIVPWSEARGLERDEARMDALDAVSSRQGDQVTREAIEVTLSASGEQSGIFWGPSLQIDRDAVCRLAARCALPEDPSGIDENAFTDRRGNVWMSFEGALRLAQAYARSEPDAVHRYIDAEETECLARGYQPGERYYHEALRDQAPAFALARRWAGIEAEAQALKAEIERLRKGIMNIVAELQRDGLWQPAHRLQRIAEGK